MSANTISFTPINDGAYYTIAQINELFRLAALVVNAKLSVAVGQERQGIVVGTSRVVNTNLDPMVLEKAGETALEGGIDFNYQRLINLGPGVNATDAITVGQAKDILGVA